MAMDQPGAQCHCAEGHAFESGSGIREVVVSSDGATSWTAASLGKDLGKFSFRKWQMPVKLASGGHELKVRATGHDGKAQPMETLWNPAGDLRNVVEATRVTAA